MLETSATDLIGAFVGHSRKAVEDKMKEARGGVLFIDEAYGLGAGGSFTNEAVDQLVAMLTLPEYVGGKTVVILAGYTHEMHQMLMHNPGLKSRFNKFIDFEDWTPKRCVDLVLRELQNEKNDFHLRDEDKARDTLSRAFAILRQRSGWGNARDAIDMIGKIIDHRDNRVADELAQKGVVTAIIENNDIDKACREAIKNRPEHVEVQKKNVEEPELFATDVKVPQQQQQKQATAKKQNEEKEKDEEEKEEVDVPEEFQEMYDTINDTLAEIEEKLRAQELDEQHRRAAEAEKRRLEELRRRLEEIARLEEEARRAAEEELRRIREREEKRQAVLRKLRSIGVCPAGFHWFVEGSGFRCRGGSHTTSFGSVEVTREEAMEMFGQ